MERGKSGYRWGANKDEDTKKKKARLGRSVVEVAVVVCYDCGRLEC